MAGTTLVSVFSVVDDFPEVSRIVDVGGVTEIVRRWYFVKRLHFASKMDIFKMKEAIVMARTSNVFAQVEPEIKEQAAPLSYGSLTREQFDAEMEKGIADVIVGKVYSADAIEAEMKKDFGV